MVQENVNERIKEIRERTGMNRREFSEHFGIPIRTIEDWEYGKRTPPEYMVKLLAYYVKMQEYKMSSIIDQGKDRKIEIIEDLDGRKIVLINDILFKAKRNLDWKEVRRYLRNLVGDCYSIQENSEKIYIGGQLPNEYAGSSSRIALKGAAAKAKAAQGIPELIQIANNPIWEENKKEKHQEDAKYGWYKYSTRFALPVYDDNGELERYNVYGAVLLINHTSNNKKYLYDILAIKKETSGSQQSV